MKKTLLCLSCKEQFGENTDFLERDLTLTIQASGKARLQLERGHGARVWCISAVGWKLRSHCNLFMSLAVLRILKLS